MHKISQKTHDITDLGKGRKPLSLINVTETNHGWAVDSNLMKCESLTLGVVTDETKSYGR